MNGKEKFKQYIIIYVYDSKCIFLLLGDDYMIYKYIYKTPDGFSNIIMNSDGEYLTGLWFEDSRDSSKHTIECEEKDLEIFKETSKWLDIYFSGKTPDFTPKYKIENLTPFRLSLIHI